MRPRALVYSQEIKGVSSARLSHPHNKGHNKLMTMTWHASTTR